MTEGAASFRRIVVALDASHASRRVLGAAAALALRQDAELVGLFVEDVNLLHMGALPFTRVAGAGPLSSQLDHATVERALSRAVGETRAALAGLLEGKSLRWSFAVVRGVAAREIIAATGTDDLLIFDDSALGRSLRPAVARTAASVLCLHGDREGAPEVLVAGRAGKAGRRALTAAALLALATGRELTVLLPAADKAAVAARVTATALLAGLELEVRYHRLSSGRRALQAAARRVPGAIVVWSAGRAESDEARTRRDIEAVLGVARCSVLLVR